MIVVDAMIVVVVVVVVVSGPARLILEAFDLISDVCSCSCSCYC